MKIEIKEYQLTCDSCAYSVILKTNSKEYEKWKIDLREDYLVLSFVDLCPKCKCKYDQYCKKAGRYGLSFSEWKLNSRCQREKYE